MLSLSCQNARVISFKQPIEKKQPAQPTFMKDVFARYFNANLVLNPNIEQDEDPVDNIPDHWTKSKETDGHLLQWTDDPSQTIFSKVLSSQYTSGEPNSFGWHQTIPNIKPGTWYEFSAAIATKGLEPNIHPDTKQMLRSSSWIGTAVKILDCNEEIIPTPGASYAGLWSFGPELSEFDPDAWVYRTFQQKGFEPWRASSQYFRTPENACSAMIVTYNYPKGTAYFDNFVLREALENRDLNATPFRKAGQLQFLQYQEDSFFPIVLWGYPEMQGLDVDIDTLKAQGFNTFGISAGAIRYRGKSDAEIRALFTEKDLALEVYLVNSFFKNKLSPLRYDGWIDDPDHQVMYQGAELARAQIENWKDFKNLLMFVGTDEPDCHPAENGSYIPNMQTFEVIKQYLEEHAPERSIYYNLCGNMKPYTAVKKDKADYYFPSADILSFTWNTPRSYPSITHTPKMIRAGEQIRWSIESSRKAESYKPVLAFGLGVYWWSKWDAVDEWHYDQFIPFNLQRFQVFGQIINGAIGVLFYAGNYINLDDQYYHYHFEQMSAISQELSSLLPVFMEPHFYDEWNVSDDRIEIMMKKHQGKIYLFAVSNHYEDLPNVTITLNDKYSITSVTCLNDILNGNFRNPVNRDVPLITPNSFLDSFMGDIGATPQSIDSPGYAVHIYEIEY